ncbi:MAG: MATE family efflux transporter, partial [Limosilactobacillus sp.]
MDKLFENTSIKRAYFILALPVVMSMAVTIIYNMVDTFFVAKTGNPDLVAGVSQGAPIFTLMIAIGDIFGLGGSSVISRLFGERRDRTARYVSGYCFYASIACGLVVTALMFIFQTPVLHMLGASPATWKYAREYYLVIAGGATFIIFGLSPNNILRTEGLATQAMIASITGTGINVVLNPIFIFSCGLGAAGSALATVVSNVIADVLMVYYLRTKSKKLTTSIHETKISAN